MSETGKLQPVDQRRLVRCSTPLCGAAAAWGGENPHIWSGYERKCDTCYHRNGYHLKSHMKRLPDTSNAPIQPASEL